jgi:exodeoxyribonuclease VIII
MSEIEKSLPSYSLGELHKDVSYESYHSQPGLRASHLHSLKKTPAHYRASLLDRGSTDALEFGRIFHFAMEHSENFLDLYRVEPDVDKRTKAGKDAMEDFKLSVKPENIIVKAKWAEPIVGMFQACMEHPKVSQMLKAGVKETSLWVEDDETGEILQCRPDFIANLGYTIDIKTTRDASESFFYGQIFRSRWADPFYILSAAHYNHCLKLAKIAKEDQFTLVAIEKEPPYGITWWPLDMGCLAPGEQWRSHLTKIYSECRKSNNWPCYPVRGVPVTPPDWVELPVTL